MSLEAGTLHGQRESAAWEQYYFRTRRNRALRRRRLGYFNFRPGELIAEVGCGDGLNLDLLREAGCTRLVGMDISPRLVAHVRSAPVFIGDVYRLAVMNGALDAVLVDSVLHHLTPLDAALAELRRVLRPGGRLCVLEPRPSILRRIFEAAMDRVPFPPPLRARQLTYFEEREVDQAWNRYFPRFQDDVRKAGFDIVQARRLIVGIALECQRR
jgi:SAM-dependent methyltransferase